MDFRRHSELEGRHAFLSASQGAWINYDDEKLINSYLSNKAKQHGTELHELAKDLIRLKVYLPKSQKTLNMYVNDAIGFRMTPEQPLFYSIFAFGTADAISFRNGELRIHDLKTGEHECKFRQLELYASYFCLEYEIAPEKINRIVLRIYQNDSFKEEMPPAERIRSLMNTIIHSDEVLTKIEDNNNEEE